MNGYNFTERVRKVLAMSREQAARMNHEYVGTEHMLLALVAEGEGVASAALQYLAIDAEEIVLAIESVVKAGRAGRGEITDLPYTSRAKKVLELSMSEARELNHSYVGTEHLLLGLFREEKGIAAQVLVDCGVTLDDARAAVLHLLDSKSGPASARVTTAKARPAPIRTEGPTEEYRASIADFGQALGPAYQVVRAELAWLYVKWDQYMALYGGAEERVALLNDIAPLFFHVAQMALWDDIILHVGRLVAEKDAPGGSGASIQRLPDFIKHPDLQSEVARLVQIAVKHAGHAREHYHVRRAGPELAMDLESRAKRHTAPSRVAVRDTLAAIAAVLNRVSAHYRRSTTTYEVGDYPNGALGLVHGLREGRDARRLRLQRLADADRHPDADHQPPLS